MMADWNPWQTLEMLRREIDNVFNETDSRREPVFRTAFLPGRAARRYPLMNLYEDQEAVYLEALAPGVDPTHFGSERCGQHFEHYRRETAGGWGRETRGLSSQ